MQQQTISALRSSIPNEAAFREMRGILEWINGVGKRFYVSSVTGNSGNNGLYPDSPKATIAQALALCTANQNDQIFCLPGHAETISAAAGVSMATAGVSLIGIGWGSNRPTLTFSATASTFAVSAANVLVRGFRFVSAIDSLVNMLDLNESYFTCEDCDFVTSSALECICFVNIATTKDEFTFRRCRFFQPTDPAGTDDAEDTGCFYFVDTEGLYVEDCFFYGQFETSIFHNKTTAAKNVWVKNCVGTQLLSTGLIYTQVAAMEGGNINCTWNHRTAADVTEATWTGTVSANFVFDVNSSVLADGAAGGQYGAPGTAANS